MAKKAKSETPANQFEFQGKKYNVIKGAIVPGPIGSDTLTPADIVVSEEAQKYLVENGCSCIEEVIE